MQPGFTNETMGLDHHCAPACIPRGALSYVKRVVQKKGKSEFAAKFMSARAKRKASALRELSLLSDLDHQRILYFHDAFEKKNMVIIITELYPYLGLSSSLGVWTWSVENRG